MTNGGQEFSGKTVEEAIEVALARFGVPQDALDIEIVSKGSRGILGFGSEPALIRVNLKSTSATPPSSVEPQSNPVTGTPVAAAGSMPPAAPTQGQHDGDEGAATGEVESTTEANEAGGQETGAAEAGSAASDDELVEMSRELLAKLVQLMGFDAEIVASWQEPDEEDSQPYLLLDIQGDDLGVLIGRRGETLASLQYLLRLMVNQRLRQWKNIVVDVEQYKRRRVNQLNQLAHRMAQQVSDTDRSVTLEPMPANERRIIHLALRDHPQVFTESIGEGDRRKVSIMPRH